MFSYFGNVLALIVLVIALLSGVLSVARDIQGMYKPPPEANKRRVFFGFVRFAFMVSAFILWLEAFSSMKGREADLHNREGDIVALRGQIIAKDRQINELQKVVTHDPALLQIADAIKMARGNPAPPKQDQFRQSVVSLAKDLRECMQNDKYSGNQQFDDRSRLVAMGLADRGFKWDSSIIKDQIITGMTCQGTNPRVILGALDRVIGYLQ